MSLSGLLANQELWGNGKDFLCNQIKQKTGLKIFELNSFFNTLQTFSEMYTIQQPFIEYGVGFNFKSEYQAN